MDNFFAHTEQIAFQTGNIVPGIDFTNDPLLQGRNFSYLDTQLKRLGGPNFTHLPVNAPRCPFSHFQQDGHMAMHNPTGRVNYEPNSWPADISGPRESPEKGFKSFPEEIGGEKRRVRSETFADHYSQARQFYISQTATEQNHIAAALTFELSKVETVAIRARMVAHLRNIDEGLANAVATGLRLRKMPEPAEAAMPTRQDFKKSPKLSILLNPPESFEGRKVGVLVTDGVDIALVDALKAALDAEGAAMEVVAPAVGGVKASDGSWIDGKQKIDGGPSVLYDAVAVLPSAKGAPALAGDPAAKQFVADAFVHCKFIAFSPEAVVLFDAAGVNVDEGFIKLSAGAAKNFVKTCRQLRYWNREATIKSA